MAELFTTKREVPQRALKFKQKDTGQEFIVVVHDRDPGNPEHWEGRRYVEVSVEAFVTLFGTQGYFPVVPNEDEAEPEDDFTEEEI